MTATRAVDGVYVKSETTDKTRHSDRHDLASENTQTMSNSPRYPRTRKHNRRSPRALTEVEGRPAERERRVTEDGRVWMWQATGNGWVE